MNSFYKNEDERRILYDWADGDFKASKALIIKSEEAVGDHYHLKKDEVFFLLKGKAKRVIIGTQESFDIEAPAKWECKRGTYHLFLLEKDSMLLCSATELFDPYDEITK